MWLNSDLSLVLFYLFAASKETPLLVTCEWTSVPNNENCDSSLLICRGLRDLRKTHVRVTIWTLQWKWLLWDHGSVVNLLSILRAMRLVEKYHNHIYHIIIDSCDSLCGFLRSPMPQHINREEKVRESDFNQIVLNSLLSNVLLNPVNFSSIHYIFRYISQLHALWALRIISWYFFKCINIKIYLLKHSQLITVVAI